MYIELVPLLWNKGLHSDKNMISSDAGSGLIYLNPISDMGDKVQNKGKYFSCRATVSRAYKTCSSTDLNSNGQE